MSANEPCLVMNVETSLKTHRSLLKRATGLNSRHLLAETCRIVKRTAQKPFRLYNHKEMHKDTFCVGGESERQNGVILTHNRRHYMKCVISNL